MADSFRRVSLALASAVLALGIAACGGEKSNVSSPVDSVNQQLAPTGVKLNCPDTVDGGEGATFTCTATGPKGKSDLQMKIVKENGQLKVAFVDDGKAKAALEQAGGSS